MAPSIKLTYFNAKGRAELSRMILAQAGVDYEDVRIEKEDWPSHKSKTPLGQVPVLEYNGEVLSQSITIARFLAKEFGLAGKTNLEQAQADMVCDAASDLVAAMYQTMFEKDEEKKKTLEQTFKTEQLPSFVTKMEGLLDSRGGKHFAGFELTWADIAVSMLLTGIKDRVGGDFLTSAPKLAALREFVYNQPKIKHWVETRPKTDM